MSLLALIAMVIVLCVVFWALRALMGAFNVPPQIQTVVTVLAVLLFVLWLVGALGLWSGGPVIRWR